MRRARLAQAREHAKSSASGAGRTSFAQASLALPGKRLRSSTRAAGQAALARRSCLVDAVMVTACLTATDGILHQRLPPKFGIRLTLLVMPAAGPHLVVIVTIVVVVIVVAVRICCRSACTGVPGPPRPPPTRQRPDSKHGRLRVQGATSINASLLTRTAEEAADGRLAPMMRLQHDEQGRHTLRLVRRGPMTWPVDAHASARQVFTAAELAPYNSTARVAFTDPAEKPSRLREPVVSRRCPCTAY